MQRRYRLELNVELDEADAGKLIELARRHQGESGGGENSVRKPGRSRKSPTEQLPLEVKEALRELVGVGDLLRKSGISLVTATCEELGNGRTTSADGRDKVSDQQGQFVKEESDPGDVDLDEFETGMYLCRWPNGEFSLVMAASKRDALVQLDEWASGHPSQLFPMESCMIDFRLSDEGRIEFTEFGEDTGDFVWKTAYPALDKVRCRSGIMRPNGEYTRKGKEVIRKAVEYERKRLWDDQPADEPAQTEAGRNIQKKLGMAGPVADYYIQEGARRILESDAPKKGKPN